MLNLLTDAGFQAFAVGGCARNALLDVPVNDVDIATDARPETVIALAHDAGIKSVPTGIEHGTVTLVSDGQGFEVTTFRKDIETDGRRAVVAFSTQLAEDAKRRDFTMNALYVAADGTIADPLDGLSDIAARRVRFIESAQDRIREDYLRILRFFRFHAWFGDPEAGIEPEALAACAELADGLETLSKERIGAEMCKLLAAPDPAPALASMAMSGVLARILPGASATVIAPIVHYEGEAGFAPDWLRRLAALGGEDPAANLRLSKVSQRRLDLLIEAIGHHAGLAELAYRHGAEMACDVALLRAALLHVPLPGDLRPLTQEAAAHEFPVRAGDLMPDLKGAALGLRLGELEAQWIASGFRLSRAELLA